MLLTLARVFFQELILLSSIMVLVYTCILILFVMINKNNKMALRFNIGDQQFLYF